MTALTAPKGPLPARVYWFRRIMALSVLFVLVFGTTRIVSGGGDTGGAGAEQATTVAAPIKAATDEKASTKDGPTPGAEATGEKGAKPSATPSAQPTPTETPKPLPSGICDNSDVTVTPTVTGPRRTFKVKIDLVMRSRSAEACTFEVSPKSVVVKVDSGPRERPDDIWSSSHCPEAVPTKKVTLYKESDTVVTVRWSGRRSDATCSNRTGWAKRGWYHAQAATYGGEPQAKQFELTRLSPVTVTRTVEPKPAPREKSKTAPKPSGTSTPTGAVEPEI